MQHKPQMSLAVYIVGLLVMLSVLYLGTVLDPELRRLGMSVYLQEYKLPGVALFFGFVFAFPVGLTICILAGLSFQQMAMRYLLLMIAVLAAIATLVFIWPALVGRDPSPLYFAGGGTVLILLISATAWYWARQRSRVSNERRLSVDLQGIGYFCFAMATWHICGVGGLPGFAIHPNVLIPIKSYPFIIGQLKVIMLYLIAAWLFIVLSLYIRQKR